MSQNILQVDELVSDHQLGRVVPFRPLVVAVGVFLCSAILAASVLWQLEMRQIQVERASISSQIAEHAHAVEFNIERALSASYALAAMVRQGGGTVTNFEAVAEEMLPFYPGVSALFLAPDGVVRQAIPLAGNERAIGHDLLKDPARTKEAFLARDTGKLTLAGPFNLVQGGLGAAGRLPVFLGKDKQKSSFWGFTAVLIRFPEVLVSARLSALPGQGLNYELWRTHPDTGKTQMIDASSSVQLVDPVVETIVVPNATWTLSVAPARGWGDRTRISAYGGLGLLFALLMGILAKMWIDTRDHQALLARQNAALEATLSRVKRLEGLLSICMQCKKIRTENNDWHQLEQYIGEHSDAVFSHGLCPECLGREMKKLD